MKDLGFVIVRHVSSKITNYYWKECYSAIRKFYPEHPILIVDDSSDPAHLVEDLVMTRCTVVYDTEHPGCAELLPYYYFHRMQPFRRAVILHDSVYLQSRLTLQENVQENTVQFLWSFGHNFELDVAPHVHELLNHFPAKDREHLRSMYAHTKLDWTGTFGVMSVVDWTWLDEIVQRFQLFEVLLPRVTSRIDRCALERVFGLVAYYHQRQYVKKPLFGDIHAYMPWGGTFVEYLTKPENYASYPVVKVWSGR